MQVLALIASLLAAVQVIFGLIAGSIICVNEGCHIVESLTVISPIYLNILGFIFFQMIFWSSRYLNHKLLQQIDFLGILLISGLTLSLSLLAYQIFLVHAFCVYCILIYIFVFILNLLHGRKQIITGGAVLAAIFFSFSILNFVPTEALSKFYSLKNAAYGVKSCASPTKEIYLIFSSDCSHCKEVLQELDHCNSCDFYLNPIDKIDLFNHEDLKLNPNYSPDFNRLILKIFGIDTVPVLISKSKEGYRFIKGEKKILDYVRYACFTHDRVLYFDDSLSSGQEGITAITEEDGECSIEIDCENE